MPVPKPLRKPVDRGEQALKRLGVTPEQLVSAPDLSGWIKENVYGGMKAALSTMRFFLDSPDIAAFIEKYDSIPVGDRDRVSWQAIAIAADLDIRRLLGSIGFSIKEHSMSTVKMKMISSQPLITDARIKYAQKPSGERDRTALETALEILPTAKGPTFIGKAIFGGTANTGGQAALPSPDDGKDEDSIDDVEPNLDVLFPPANAIQEKLIPIRQRLLERGNGDV